MDKWDGNERRKPSEDGREGRRPYDRHCGQHQVLWDHNEADKKEHRGIVCGKISKLDSDLQREVDKLEKADDNVRTAINDLSNNMVGKFWFRVSMGVVFACLLYLAAKQEKYSEIIISNQSAMSESINKIENAQIKAIERIGTHDTDIDKLNKRQDILRDQNIKILEKLH